MAICVVVDCKSDSINLVEIVENLSFYEFPREKSETAIVHKNKT